MAGTTSSPICPLAGRPWLLIDVALGLRGGQGAAGLGVGWSLGLRAKVPTRVLRVLVEPGEERGGAC